MERQAVWLRNSAVLLAAFRQVNGRLFWKLWPWSQGSGPTDKTPRCLHFFVLQTNASAIWKKQPQKNTDKPNRSRGSTQTFFSSRPSKELIHCLHLNVAAFKQKRSRWVGYTGHLFSTGPALRVEVLGTSHGKLCTVSFQALLASGGPAYFHLPSLAWTRL